MSEQTDRIVKKLRDDAKQSKKEFLSDVAEKVEEVLSDNMQNQEFKDAANLLTDNINALDKVEEISMKVELLDSICSSIQKIDVEISEIKSNGEGIAVGIQNLQETIKSEDNNSMISLIYKLNRKLYFLYAINGVSVAGIVVMLILYLLK